MKLKNPVLTVACVWWSLYCPAPFMASRAVHAVQAAFVQVTNTSANPVINQDVDSPGRNPYYQTVTCYSASSPQCQAQFPVSAAKQAAGSAIYFLERRYPDRLHHRRILHRQLWLRSDSAHSAGERFSRQQDLHRQPAHALLLRGWTSSILRHERPVGRVQLS